MQVLLVYGTTDGQTEKIVGFVVDRLRRQGHQVVAANAGDGPPLPDPRNFDAILVAASVHLGRYQAAVIRFVRERRAVISARANAFLSVSLSAAGHDPDDAAGLQMCVANFIRATGWAPHRIHHVAGAFRYTAYHFLTRYVMKYKAYRKGAPTDTRHDYELTDWDDLARFVDTFACTAMRARSRRKLARRIVLAGSCLTLMSGIAAAPTVRLQLVADVPLGGETTCLDNASPLKNVGGTDCVANHEPRACIRAIIRPWRDYLPLGRSL